MKLNDINSFGPGDDDDGLAGFEWDEDGDGLALDSGGGPGDCLLRADSDGADGDFLEDLDAILDGHGGEQLLVGMVGGEEDLGLAPNLLEQLSEAARRRLSLARKREGKARLKGVTEEDFDEGPERDAFLVIKSYRNELFNTKLAPWGAMQYFFAAGDDGGAHLRPGLPSAQCAKGRRASSNPVRVLLAVVGVPSGVSVCGHGGS